MAAHFSIGILAHFSISIYTDALQGLTNKRFPTLFPENYSFAERKNFIGNALQSDGIKRGSPPLRLENQPVMAGMDRMSGIKRI